MDRVLVRIESWIDSWRLDPREVFTDAQQKYYHNIKHCGMCILDIQNLQLSDNNFDISINDLNLEGDVSYIETSINHYFKSYKVLQQATHNLNL